MRVRGSYWGDIVLCQPGNPPSGGHSLLCHQFQRRALYVGMGNVSSRSDEGAALFLRDHVRCKLDDGPAFLMICANRHGFPVSIASLTVINARQKPLLNAVPNIYPATRIIARRDIGDEGLVDYIQVRTPHQGRCSRTDSESGTRTQIAPLHLLSHLSSSD